MDTVFTSHHSNISTFLWDPPVITKSNPFVSLPTEPISLLLYFSFPLHPFNRVPLPKHKLEPIKIEEARTPISTITRVAPPISLTCIDGAISSIKASSTNEVWRNVTHFLDMSRMISSDPTRCYLIPFFTLSACFFI